MSKELIETLRAFAPYASPNAADLMREAADALEAKAAPVSERDAYEAWKLSMKPYGFDGFDAYQGAREDLAIWKRRALEAEARVRQQDQIIDQMGEDLNAINGPTFMGEPVLPRQQAREVVMPEIPYQWSKSLTHCWPDDKDDRDGDWCVGCIDEEGNFYEVVKVEASQYDAGGESQKIAEAIVALWEFARLNGKEVV